MFKKRETVLQNMTYIALMSAVNVIFVLLTTLLPYLFFLIIFLLPLTSVVVYCFCKKRFFPIYAVATIGLCMVFNLWRVTDTIFYVIPSIVTGLIFGVFIERRVPAFYLILVSTIVGMIMTYASFPLIKLFVEIDTIEYFLKIFKLDEFEFRDYLPPLFIFVISSIQMALTYLIIRDEVVKLGISINNEDASDFVLLIFNLSLIVLSIGFAFIYGPISFVLFGLSIFITVYQFILLFIKNKIISLVGIGVALLIAIFGYAIANGYIPKPFSYLIFLSITLVVNIVSISNICLENYRNKDKLNKEH